jgi:hypothetical protein
MEAEPDREYWYVRHQRADVPPESAPNGVYTGRMEAAVGDPDPETLADWCQLDRNTVTLYRLLTQTGGREPWRYGPGGGNDSRPLLPLSSSADGFAPYLWAAGRLLGRIRAQREIADRLEARVAGLADGDAGLHKLALADISGEGDPGQARGKMLALLRQTREMAWAAGESLYSFCDEDRQKATDALETTTRIHEACRAGLAAANPNPNP